MNQATTVGIYVKLTKLRMCISRIVRDDNQIDANLIMIRTGMQPVFGATKTAVVDEFLMENQE